jgi:hypothetical protein
MSLTLTPGHGHPQKSAGRYGVEHLQSTCLTRPPKPSFLHSQHVDVCLMTCSRRSHPWCVRTAGTQAAVPRRGLSPPSGTLLLQGCRVSRQAGLQLQHSVAVAQKHGHEGHVLCESYEVAYHASVSTGGSGCRSACRWMRRRLQTDGSLCFTHDSCSSSCPMHQTSRLM